MLKPVMNKHFFSILLLCLLVSSPVEARLTLGVVTGTDEASGEIDSAQARSLAGLLTEKLQEDVVVKELSDSATLISWLDRFAMLDLALLSAKDVKANRGRFLLIGQFDEQSKLNLVARHGVSGDLPQRAARIVRESGFAPWRSAATIAPPAKQIQEESPLSVEPESTPIDVGLSGQVELQHVPPLSPGRAWEPPEVVVKAFQEIPEVDEPEIILPVSEMPDVATALPAPVTMPAEPVKPAMVEVVKIPDLPLRQSKPLQPEVPSVPTSAVPVAVPELTTVAKPLVVPEVPSAPVVESQDVAPRLVPEEPVIAVAPPVPPEMIIPEPVAPPDLEQPEIAVVVLDAVSSEPEIPIVAPAEPAIESGSVAGKERPAAEQQKIIEEVLTFAEAVPAHELTRISPLVIDDNEDELRDDEIIALLGEYTVAAVVAQPDLPLELRPPGIPVIRPGRITRRSTVAEDELLVASIPEPRKKIEPARPPKLLPEPEPEPGIVYVIPFVSIMVPNEVNARILDQFVDTLNREGKALGLQFVILKGGLQRVDPEWLAIRKYVTGEIYAYVEDAGSSWTELRTKARLTYRRPDQDAPAFDFEYPVKSFFDHDRSTIDMERTKLSDDIAVTLASELLKALQN